MFEGGIQHQRQRSAGHRRQELARQSTTLPAAVVNAGRCENPLYRSRALGYCSGVKVPEVQLVGDGGVVLAPRFGSKRIS